MPILGKPIVIPPKTLDQFWLAIFSSVANLVEQQATLSMSIVPYNEQGEMGEVIHLDPVDIFARVNPQSPEFDLQAAQIYQSILAYATKEAIAQGKIQAP